MVRGAISLGKEILGMLAPQQEAKGPSHAALRILLGEPKLESYRSLRAQRLSNLATPAGFAHYGQSPPALSLRGLPSVAKPRLLRGMPR